MRIVNRIPALSYKYFNPRQVFISRSSHRRPDRLETCPCRSQTASEASARPSTATRARSDHAGLGDLTNAGDLDVVTVNQSYREFDSAGKAIGYFPPSLWSLTGEGTAASVPTRPAGWMTISHWRGRAVNCTTHLKTPAKKEGFCSTTDNVRYRHRDRYRSRNRYRPRCVWNHVISLGGYRLS